MNLNNKYFVRGLLFVLAGVIFMLWNFNVIRINIFAVVNLLVAIALIFYGDRYVRFTETRSMGRIMIIFGVVLITHSLLVHIIGIPIKFIFAVAFLILGFYFIFVRSRVFIRDKGVFKDSRDGVYIKENFSSVCINNFSNDISYIKVRSFFSDLSLNFISTRMITKDTVDFEISAIFGNVRVNINSSWNVILNGSYVRRIETAHKTVNIRSRSLFCNVNVY